MQCRQQIKIINECIIIYRVKQKMKSKVRPFSSKPNPSLPIYIDESEIDSFCDCHSNTIQKSRTKPRLNQIMPSLGQLPSHSNSTALLYSKFIVKGLKNEKIDAVRKSRQKKQEITEACTQNKQTTHQRSISKHTSHHDMIKEVKDTYFDDESSQNFQFQNFLRTSSAKVFRRPNEKYPEAEEKFLVKNMTQANLKGPKTQRRPTTAKQTKNGNQNLVRNTIGQKNRPSTAKAHDKFYNNFMNMDEQLIKKKLTLDAKPLKVVDEKKIGRDVNYIQSNKQRVSAYSKKSNSIYLTNANIVENISRKMHPTTQNKNNIDEEKHDSFTKMKRISQKEEVLIHPQTIFTKDDLESNELKRHDYEKYLKCVMPVQYENAKNEFKRQLKQSGKVIEAEFGELLSINLDVAPEVDRKEIDEQESEECFKDYLRHCDILQYNIRAQIKNNKTEGVQNQTLDIWECKKILELEQKKNSVEATRQHKRHLNEEIREITRKLKFFSHQNQDSNKKFFNLPFQIVTFEEDFVIISENSKVESLYIILNGSVVSRKQEILGNAQCEKEPRIPNTNIPYQAQVSIFDGELFGEPKRPSDPILEKQFKTLEPTLVMKIPYLNYTQLFMQGSEFEEKINILKIALASELQNKLIKNEDLELISLAIEKQSYPAKSLVFRQGEIFDKLIFIGRGKVASINEFVLVRGRGEPKDMKERDRNLIRPRSSGKRTNVKRGEDQAKDAIEINSLRKSNLINYEILRQKRDKIYYYYMKENQQYVKGDTLNWESLHEMYALNPTRQDGVVADLATAVLNLATSLDPNPMNYSLMANSDTVEIYTLSKNSFQYLPNEVKKIFLVKAGQKASQGGQNFESEKEVREWDHFKQKLCEQILEDKRKRK